jgi:hypothetical protein
MTPKYRLSATFIGSSQAPRPLKDKILTILSKLGIISPQNLVRRPARSNYF